MGANAPPEPMHIVVATPCYGGLVTHHYTSSLLKLQRALLEADIGLSIRLLGGESLITRARNLLVDQFLAIEDATHLLFIDADIGFSPDQVLRLAKQNKDIAGAAYPLKGRINGELHYVVDFAGSEIADGFARARYLGTGFMMIKRPVFAAFAQHYPEIAYRRVHTALNVGDDPAQHHAFFDCMIEPETGLYLSEDFAFCKRWTGMGGEIWVDLDSKLTHVGTAEYHGDLLAKLDSANPVQ